MARARRPTPDGGAAQRTPPLTPAEKAAKAYQDAANALNKQRAQEAKQAKAQQAKVKAQNAQIAKQNAAAKAQAAQQKRQAAAYAKVHPARPITPNVPGPSMGFGGPVQRSTSVRNIRPGLKQRPRL